MPVTYLQMAVSTDSGFACSEEVCACIDLVGLMLDERMFVLLPFSLICSYPQFFVVWTSFLFSTAVFSLLVVLICLWSLLACVSLLFKLSSKQLRDSNIHACLG